MNDRIPSIQELDRAELVKASGPVNSVEQQCKMTLAADWREGQPELLRVVSFRWNPGGTNGRDTLLVIRPGQSAVRPLWQAQCWLGPFAYNRAYAMADTERERQGIKARYEEEKKRILDQYDYPRPAAMSTEGLQPTGPHRFPDFTVCVLEPDGSEGEPIRLHELYEIGAFDKSYPIEAFGRHETAAQVQARFEAELAAKDAEHQRELSDYDKKLERLTGMVQGLAVSVAGKNKTAEAAGV